MSIPSHPSRPDEDANALVAVAEAETEVEAQAKSAILEEAGIESFVFGSERGWFGSSRNHISGRSVPVMVRAADRSRARAILEEQMNNYANLDWDSVDVGSADEEERIAARLKPRRVVLLTLIAGIVGVLIWIVWRLI